MSRHLPLFSPPPTNLFFLTDRAVHKHAKRHEPQRPPRVVRQADDRLRDQVPHQEPDKRRRGLDGDGVVGERGVVGRPEPPCQCLDFADALVFRYLGGGGGLVACSCWLLQRRDESLGCPVGL